jgi:predicted nucleotidyltransferase component of viral defense system
MLPPALVRQYAVGQRIDVAVADQEIVLHYVLALLNAQGLIGSRPGAREHGPLLFKGGTALRKCVFGSTGRFSQDIDLDATHRNGFEAEIEAAFHTNVPYHGIRFSVPDFRYSQDENFSGTVHYEHQHANGTFELQISYRLEPVLKPRTLTLVPQGYFARVECGVPDLFGIDPYEMIGEKLMACNRRLGGSAKDVYDLYLWTQRPFDAALVRRLAILKTWTDRRRQPRFDPEPFLARIEPASFRWEDIQLLVPHSLPTDRRAICDAVRERFAFLTELDTDEHSLLDDQTAHRQTALFDQLQADARARAATVPR